MTALLQRYRDTIQIPQQRLLISCMTALVLVAGASKASDRFEPNDSFGAAAELGTLGDRTETNLSIHAAGNDDYYRFTAATDGEVSVQIFFSNAAGDLDLQLLDASQAVLDSSTSIMDQETVASTVTGGSNYVIRVFGYVGATNVYDLAIDGPGDRFEPNDSFASPAELGTLGDRTETNLSIHTAGNDDFYRFTAGASGEMTIQVLFTHAAGDLDMALLNTSQAILVSSASVTDNEAVTYTVTGGTSYVIQVQGYAGATNVYDLVIDGPGDRFEPNDSFAAPAELGTLGDRTETNLSIHLPDNDDYYRFTAATGGGMTIQILFAHAAGDLDLQLLNTAEQIVVSSASVTDDEAVAYTVAGGSNYVIRVLGYVGATNVYDLVIDGPEEGPVINLLIPAGGPINISWPTNHGNAFNVWTNADLTKSNGWGVANDAEADAYIDGEWLVITNTLGSEETLFYRLEDK